MSRPLPEPLAEANRRFDDLLRVEVDRRVARMRNMPTQSWWLCEAADFSAAQVEAERRMRVSPTDIRGL